MVGLLVHTLVWSTLAAPPAPAFDQAQAHVQVKAVQGEIEPALLASTCKAIQKNFSLPCRYSLVPTPDRWSQSSGRIDAAAFLDAQFSKSAAAAHPKHAKHKQGRIDLWLTSKDLFEGSRPFVFGIMSMTDRIGIVSTHRLVDPRNPELTRKRTHKVVVHELAHALDLGHHDLDSCAMQVEPDLAHLDQGASTLCRHCRRRAQKTLGQMKRRGQFLWDRAVGHQVRGELRQAQNLLLPLLREPKVDPELKARARLMWSRILTK